jgi:hypothetical protein
MAFACCICKGCGKLDDMACVVVDDKFLDVHRSCLDAMYDNGGRCALCFEPMDHFEERWGTSKYWAHSACIALLGLGVLNIAKK